MFCLWECVTREPDVLSVGMCDERTRCFVCGNVCGWRSCGKCGRTYPALFRNLTLFLPVVADSAIYFVNVFCLFLDVLNVLSVSVL